MEANANLSINTTFWKDKRVILTGGAGFLGSFVTQKLQKLGAAQIFIPKIENYDLVNLVDIQRMYADALEDHPDGQLKTIVIHLAALAGGIGANRARPADFFYINLMMGVQLMHQAWKLGIDKFVAIGTICAYPKFTPMPFQEKNLWDGYPEETNAPYGLAKKMLLVQAQAYREQYEFNAIYLLPVNLYGPRDNFNLETSHVIPALIHKFIDAQERGLPEVVLWGDGSPTREFLYVEDAAEGILLAAERYNGSEPVNLGAGNEISIHDLANTISRLTGFEGKIVWDTSKPNGQPRRALDVSRAQEYFGFRAKMTFEEGLRRTIAWYREHESQIAGLQQG
jgi:GDP-L-fucose synthase